MNELKKQHAAVMALLDKYDYHILNVNEIEIALRSSRLGETDVLTCHINIRPVSKKAHYIMASGDTFKSTLLRLELELANKSEYPF